MVILISRQVVIAAVTALCLLGALSFASGCSGPRVTQTAAFDQAEEHYRAGDYDAALDGYQAFLEAYPDSPLAETVKLRIRSIHREIRSVMMRKDVPRPTYVGGAGRGLSEPSANRDLAPREPEGPRGR